ncbi:putative MFS family arabinose efflux permease [Humitalea rosea]|uniref:Putative MFS family arabinose efflux permease n=1 Tax=Humitalea rosea TaxID=990373 RepID=A0A2W7I0I7_9PROT|nr:MFS transporter [Humitalea rosea]PZW38972.1 putative MFS family arabinose efflux permease [Humitalea rosea]
MAGRGNKIDEPEAVQGRLRDLPRGIWALGLVSMLMDISSEMIHALLPIYFVTVLGTSMVTVGAIEGIAEATASIVKIFSGALSDWLGRRKLLAAIGYGLAAFTKPVFPLASSVGWLVGARFVDRIGKGIRGAPRDALVADLAPAQMRGASFGLRQSLDTVGAFLGPLFAIGLMWATANDIKAVFWWAVPPAFLSLALIIFAVPEPARPTRPRKTENPMSLGGLKALGATFWWVVAVSGLFTLARFSDAFLVLRAQNVGVPIALVPAVMVLMNIVYAGIATPAGFLSDRLGRQGILLIGFAWLIVADLLLALVPSFAGLALGVVAWGIHMGLTAGILTTLVADTVPKELRGTAFGAFHFVSGIAMLAASLIAGLLWDGIGPAGTFLSGAGFTALALVGFLLLRERLNPSKTLDGEGEASL